MRLLCFFLVLVLSFSLVSGLSSNEVEDSFPVLFAPSVDESVAFWISFVFALFFVVVALGWFFKNIFLKKKKKRRKRKK